MKQLSVISLGLGVQSTMLYYLSSLDMLPRADVAIFADTGGEKIGTLIYLKYLKKWAKENNGIPIIVDKSKNLYRDLLNQKNTENDRFSSIPAFTKGNDGNIGMLRRQCTNEYKIQVVDQAIRKLYKLKPRQRNIETIIWKGISIEEIERMTIPEAKWKVFYYPFCGYTIDSKGGFVRDKNEQIASRSNIIELYKKMGLPVPPKSSVPLKSADLKKDQTKLDFGECSGNCHI